MSRVLNSVRQASDSIDFFDNLLSTNKWIYKYNSFTQNQHNKFHECLYFLKLIAVKLSKKNPKEIHRYVFCYEMVSDSLHIYTISLQGFPHICKILKRRIIENFFNHFFYFDHYIEFLTLENGGNDYVPIKNLKEYLINHPIYSKHKCAHYDNFVNEIMNEYVELCKTVHAKGINNMSLVKNLDELKDKDFDIVDFYDGLILLFQKMIYVIYKSHRDITLSSIEKSLASKVIPGQYISTFFN